MPGPNAGHQEAAAFASPNFRHLAKLAPLIALRGAQAERYVFDEPSMAVFRLRQFGEALAQEVAANAGLYTSEKEGQLDLLRRLRAAEELPQEAADLFHVLRTRGNLTVHGQDASQRDALHALRAAWHLGVWFQQAFHDTTFKSGPFTPPPEPKLAEVALLAELVELRQLLSESVEQVQHLQLTAQQEAERRRAATAQAAAAYEDLAVAMDLAGETETKAIAMEAEFRARLQRLQDSVAAAPADDIAQAKKKRQRRGQNLVLDESETRLLIDAQLRDAGWEADSVALSFKAGAHPIAGRNQAIAEYPTANGPADYVLFVGLTPVAVVEAKRQTSNVSGAIEQAKRYSKGFRSTGEPPAKGAPWGEYNIPFLYATNGRPHLPQLKTQSGIWFLDARRSTNLSRDLTGWHTPQGLVELLEHEPAVGDAKLADASADYLPLRDYQQAAIAAVETALAAGKRDMLLAMATGTGKTRLALGLIYRLLKARRFRRVLFLVDRTALGEQAHEAFAHVQLERLQTLPQIYDVKGLGDLSPDDHTRLHIATVQGMVKRILYAADDAPPVPIDWYDCVIIDECHRGYALDRDMTETQLAYRSELDYLSKYRRVLDHFDAVRIGLTATPALHTTQIFGKPIFQYTYRQAVIDGYLVDHEPPIRLLTRLNQEGIHWKTGDEVQVLHTASGQLDLFEAPDEIDIEVDGFNTQVQTENFNRVVCQYLAAEIDPKQDAKTMVFCVTDAHADLVVMLLKQALADRYGEIEDDAVMKITGAADKPLQKLKRYKNERLPSFAVTVDLLTTGIDVPTISNLVFLRRVKSRILYEQMVGRATRLCPEIGKEYFRIYDAVDLYVALQDHTEMKPVVTRPHLTFTQLVDELLTIPDEEHGRAVLDEIVAKLQPRRARLAQTHAAAVEDAAGQPLDDVVALLKQGDVAAATAFFAAHPKVAPLLDEKGDPQGQKLLISDHLDELLGTASGYGNAKRPEDYLAGFKAFLDANANQLDALMVVTQRPRDLTRKQLRALKMALDEAGYAELTVQKAWAQVSSQDIAASIIGFIRQQALGSPLVPYRERVEVALGRILAQRTWTTPQRQWLLKIGKQLELEGIVDKEALERGAFKTNGGFKHLNRVFDGQLETVLGDLQEEIWRDRA